MPESKDDKTIEELRQQMLNRGNVAYLDVPTTLDIPCERVIEGVNQDRFSRILAIGITEEGDLVVASHTSDIGAQLLLMERAKDFLLHDADTV